MRKKKITEEKEFEKQLAEVEFPDDDQSKRENEMIYLLKNILNEYVRTSHVLTNQNSQVIELLTKLKERFI